MKNPWKKLSSKIVHQNPWFYVRKDAVIRPSGKRGEYNVVVTPKSVFIVAINEKKEVYLVGMFRYTTGMYSLEIPAGSSDGERPLLAAKRELKEEAGLTAKSWKLIGTFQVANGLLSEMGYVYLAQKLTEVPENEQSEEGIEEVLRVPFEKVLQMIADGKINDGQTITAVALARKSLGF